MPIKRIRAAVMHGEKAKHGASSTRGTYMKSIARSAGTLIDPTGRSASAGYAVRDATCPSAAKTIAKDWSSVGRTLSNAFMQTPVRHAKSKRR
jgi:hypothetical protein